MSRRQRNRHAIELYITNYDRLFPASMGFINVEEMTGKPESRPPIPLSDHVWEYLEDPENRRTAFYLAPIFSRMSNEKPPLYLIVGLVGGWIKPLQDEEADHAALRRWKAGETEQDRNRAELFERALSWLEEKLNDERPQIEITVKVPKRDNLLQGLVHQRNIDNNSLRSHDARSSYRQIDAAIKGIIQKEECSVEAAIGLYRDRLKRDKEPDVCPRKIKTARAFVKREAEINRIMKEEHCSVERALDLYDLRIEVKRGAHEKKYQ